MKRFCLAAAGLLLINACSSDKGRQRPEPNETKPKTKPALRLSDVLARPAFAYAQGKGPRQVSLSDIAERAVLSVVNISGSLGWYQFSGEDDQDGTSIWEFTTGPQVDFGKLYAGFEVGYFTTMNEWGVVPNLGIRKDMIDISLRYKVTGDGKFFAMRAGLYF